MAGIAPHSTVRSHAKWQFVHLATTRTSFHRSIRTMVSANSQRLPRATRLQPVPSSPRLWAKVATMCSLRVGGFRRSSSLGCTGWPAKSDFSEKRLVALATGRLAMYFALLKAGIFGAGGGADGRWAWSDRVVRSFVASVAAW